MSCPAPTSSPAKAGRLDAMAMRVAAKQSRETCITGHSRCASFSEKTFLPVMRAKSLFNSGRNGCDHVRCLVEGLVPIRDSVPVRNPGEICIQDPDLTLLILINKKPNRPVEPRCWIGGQEQCSERGISKHEKRGWAQG